MQNQRGYNFGAGPAMLPEAVLQQAQAQLLNWQGSGMSVMEVGHRTPAFAALMEEAEQHLRDLLHIPSNYHVLFLGMPARMQFAMIPLNALPSGGKAGYLVTGLWSSLAYQEANMLKNAYAVAHNTPENYYSLPAQSSWQIEPESAYIYCTPNETVHGLRLPVLPAHNRLVADMTSCLLTEPLNIEDYGLIFAGAQKNIANAGLTIVIVRDNMVNQTPNAEVPTILQYKTHIAAKSLYATPPGFNCYLAHCMFTWIKAQGGLETMQALNQEKSSRLYDYLDDSKFYTCLVADEHARSRVNICFAINKPGLEATFIDYAQQRGLYALQGHRQAQGLRVSLYNAMPMAGVEALIACLQDFAKAYF